MQSRNYDDKDGTKRNAVEVIIDSAEFVESKGAGGKSATVNSAENTGQATSDESSDPSETGMPW